MRCWPRRFAAMTALPESRSHSPDIAPTSASARGVEAEDLDDGREPMTLVPAGRAGAAERRESAVVLDDI